MSDRAEWTVDVCTCGHRVTAHANGEGRCDECDRDTHYTPRLQRLCTRYQWNGEPRKRVW